ncbi:hypothetical protein [Streptococcus sp. S784/96/1]|uniref:hypothetical protein n=1 Tax=Streptococcus sp. S784/96/1 TaxID=2653499 RepID=UPI0013899EC2|nr:hypothetical protein [Streptococcus sp. S784/96/1]
MVKTNILNRLKKLQEIQHQNANGVYIVEPTENGYKIYEHGKEFLELDKNGYEQWLGKQSANSIVLFDDIPD